MSAVVKTLILVLFAAQLLAFQNCGGISTSSTGASYSSVNYNGQFGLQVSGTQFVSTMNGAPVQLLGVSISGLEQGASALNVSAGEYNAATDPGFAAMASWNINLVRIPLNEETWLGIHNCMLDSGTSATLQANLKQIVANANAAGLYVILDLHWAAPNAFGCPEGQGMMPDADNGINFWVSVANTFKNNPAVIFEMMNEPFGTNNYANWVAALNSNAPAGQSASDLSILINGGTYTGFMYQCNTNCNLTFGNEYTSNIGTFHTVGFQAILNAIRGTGAKNIVLANPIGWAGEIQTWLDANNKWLGPVDPAGQLGVGWHESGGGQTTINGSAAAILATNHPILITEAYNAGAAATGAVDPNGTNYFSWAMGKKVGYSYWAWVSWTGGILNDTKTYNPNALGQSLKSAYCSQPKVNSLASCP